MDHPLRLAVTLNKLNTVRYLINKNANIHTNYDESLRVSCKNGNLDMVRYLVGKGADVNALRG